MRMNEWKERLFDYRKKLREHEYMKERIRREIRDREFDIVDDSPRFSWEIRVCVDPVSQCLMDLRDFESREIPAIRQYESSDCFEHDQNMERLENLEKREHENKYHIENEKRERSMRQGYGRDYGFETGSVILAICQVELDEMDRLRKWKQELIKECSF